MTLDSVGGITFRATYHLRGNDYYSARNYASRVIGQKLVFYTPPHLSPGAQDPFATFPAVRKWHAGATAAEFHRVVEAISEERAVVEAPAGARRCFLDELAGSPARSHFGMIGSITHVETSKRT